MFENLFGYLQSYRKYLGRRLYVVFALSALAAGAEVLGIALLLPLLVLLDPDAAAGSANGGVPELSSIGERLRDLLSVFGLEDSLGGILGFIGLAFLLKGLIKFAEIGYASHLKALLMEEVRTKLFDGYSTVDYAYYSRYNTGRFVDLITVQVNTLLASFDSFKVFLAAAITAAAYLGFVFIISWPFATMALLGGGFILLLFRRLSRFVRRLSFKVVSESATLNHFLVQTLQAFKYLTSTAGVEPLRIGVVGSIRRLAGYQRVQGLANGLTDSLREPVAVAVLIAVVLVQVTVLGGAIGPVLVAVILIYRAISQLVALQSNWQKTMQRIGSLEVLEEEFARVESNQEISGTRVLGPLEHGIVLDRVSFTYDTGARPALRDVSLRIPVNRTIALVGESGAGKSTLVDLLTLILRPTTGELRIDGISSHDVSLRSWRRQIGYVSQETVVFDDTVANNICLWRGSYDSDPEIRARIERAAEQASARGFIEELPEGFNSRVGDRGVRLSGGQRQRLFIARELYKSPRLLILDEATSALDSEAEAAIRESVDRLRGSITIVIIAHRLSTIRNADYIYVLENGRIVEDGTYGELCETPQGAFNRMVALQAL